MIIRCLKLVVALILIATQSVYALPTGGTVVSGTATIETDANNMVVTTSDKAHIQWDTFNIASNEGVFFKQPSATSIVFNEILDVNRSVISGSLVANGNIVLSNVNGIRFSSTADVDINGLIATTYIPSAAKIAAGLSTGAFDFSGGTSGNATIENEGSINALDGGVIAFAAPGVKNSGAIGARLGKVSLAAGTEFTVDFFGDGLVALAAGKNVSTIVNDSSGNVITKLIELTSTGTINADGGTVAMRVQAAANLIDNVINTAGIIRAQTVTNGNTKTKGTIILHGGDPYIANDARKRVLVTGKLDARGLDAGEAGGEVRIVGRVVELDGSRVDVTGSASGSGGNANIGGDPADVVDGGNYNGGTEKPLALGTYIHADSYILTNSSAADKAKVKPTGFIVYEQGTSNLVFAAGHGGNVDPNQAAGQTGANAFAPDRQNLEDGNITDGDSASSVTDIDSFTIDVLDEVMDYFRTNETNIPYAIRFNIDRQYMDVNRDIDATANNAVKQIALGNNNGSGGTDTGTLTKPSNLGANIWKEYHDAIKKAEAEIDGNSAFTVGTTTGTGLFVDLHGFSGAFTGSGGADNSKAIQFGYNFSVNGLSELTAADLTYQSSNDGSGGYGYSSNTGDVLKYSSTTKSFYGRIRGNSFYSLGVKRQGDGNGLDLDDIMRGTTGLGKLLHDEAVNDALAGTDYDVGGSKEYRVWPSNDFTKPPYESYEDGDDVVTIDSGSNTPNGSTPAAPFGNADQYFSGGYSVDTHGSSKTFVQDIQGSVGKNVDGLQIEMPKFIRFDSGERVIFARTFSKAVKTFTTSHYNTNWATNNLPSAPADVFQDSSISPLLSTPIPPLIAQLIAEGKLSPASAATILDSKVDAVISGQAILFNVTIPGGGGTFTVGSLDLGGGGYSLGGNTLGGGLPIGNSDAFGSGFSTGNVKVAAGDFSLGNTGAMGGFKMDMSPLGPGMPMPMINVGDMGKTMMGNMDSVGLMGSGDMMGPMNMKAMKDGFKAGGMDMKTMRDAFESGDMQAIGDAFKKGAQDRMPMGGPQGDRPNMMGEAGGEGIHDEGGPEVGGQDQSSAQGNAQIGDGPTGVGSDVSGPTELGGSGAEAPPEFYDWTSGNAPTAVR